MSYIFDIGKKKYIEIKKKEEQNLRMSITTKFSNKIAHIFSNDKKSNASAQVIQASQDLEVSQEKARKELLKLHKTSRSGFPFKPTCMAYDCVQHLLAIGTKNGYIKIFGGDSVEYTIFHASSSINQQQQQQQQQSNSNGNNTPSCITLTGSPLLSTMHMAANVGASNANLPLSSAILFIQFIVNEGALVVYCEDSTLSFWNLRQKQPGLLFSKKLVNEKLVYSNIS